MLKISRKQIIITIAFIALLIFTVVITNNSSNPSRNNTTPPTTTTRTLVSDTPTASPTIVPTTTAPSATIQTATPIPDSPVITQTPVPTEAIRNRIHPKVEAAGKNLNQYNIQARLDTSEMKLYCTQQIKYTNTTGKTLKQVSFQVYPNAYKSIATTPYYDYQMASGYPDGFNPGGIQMQSVTVNNTQVDPTYELNEVVMNVPLKNLANRKSVNIQLTYTITIPKSEGRFGYTDKAINLGNWFPILCVYDTASNDFFKTKYYASGDPFYSEVANYNLIMDLPVEYTLAVSGDIMSKQIDKDRRIWHVEAYAMRDLACVISDKFIISSKTVGDTVIYSYILEGYCTQEISNKALQVSADAFSHFEAAFGEYPYNQFSVVQCDLNFGGMEYPGLIMIGTNLYSPGSASSLEYVIAHEVANQWWYGMVGNNEVTEPWLDEGLTTWSTIYYYKMQYGDSRFIATYKQYVYNNYLSYRDNAQQGGKKINEVIDKPIFGFSSDQDYTKTSYQKAAIMFHTLYELLGEDRFISCLQDYFDQNCFKIADKAALKNCLLKSKINTSPVIDSFLNGTVQIN